MAVKFIKEIAEKEKLPVVINISQGINAGSHDGKSLYEDVYEKFTDSGTKPGYVVIKSAGNQQETERHAKISVRESETISWYSQNSSRKEDIIQLWFDSANRFKFQLCSPKNKEESLLIDLSLEGQTITRNFPSGNLYSITYHKHHHRERNVDSCLEIRINKANAKSIHNGSWKLRIERELDEGRIVGDIHAWIEINSIGGTITFNPPHQDREITLTLPGTAENVITVGAVRKNGDRFRVTRTSSLGPRRNNQEDKPCIAAPGENVCAALSGTEDGVCKASGTSIAAPHVSGAVALILSARHKASTRMLSAAEIQEEIQQIMLNPNRGWDKGEGFGVLDVDRLFSRLT